VGRSNGGWTLLAVGCLVVAGGLLLALQFLQLMVEERSINWYALSIALCLIFTIWYWVRENSK